MKILMVLTSHDQLGNTGRKTGFWLEEFAAPYYVFKDGGAQLVLASPKGGQPPLDPKSDDADAQTDATRRFRADAKAVEALAHTLPLAEAAKALAHTLPLAEAAKAQYDAVFYPGGHGPLWDLAEDPISADLIERTYAAGKPVGAVCHGPAVFRHTRFKGEPLVRGKRVTGFTNGEEAAVGLTDVVPFLVEDMLKEHGAHYSKKADFHAYAVTDGNLVTGQNPASSVEAAKAVLALLRNQD